MKNSEFKQAIRDIGVKYDIDLEVTEDNFVIHIMHGIIRIATVSKLATYIIDTSYGFFRDIEEESRRDLLYVMYKFASTPIDEREDEKRYIIPLPHLITSDGEQQYLTHSGSFFAARRDKGLRQTWKEEHLKHIPEEYRKYAVEVEEWEYLVYKTKNLKKCRWV